MQRARDRDQRFEAGTSGKQAEAWLRNADFPFAYENNTPFL
jgi:hypothetical protein